MSKDLIIFDDEQELFNKHSDTYIRYMKLPDEVENIHKVLKVDKRGQQVHDILFDFTFHYVDDFINSSFLIYDNLGQFDEISPFVIKQDLTNIRNEFFVEEIYTFNHETKMIYFNGNSMKKGDKLIILASIRENENRLYQNELFRKLLISYTLRQWINNLSLKYNQEDANVIGNGLKLNISGMKEYAERLEDEIREEIDSNTYFMTMGVTRLYN